jgi:hypothetical protein
LQPPALGFESIESRQRLLNPLLLGKVHHVLRHRDRRVERSVPADVRSLDTTYIVPRNGRMCGVKNPQKRRRSAPVLCGLVMFCCSNRYPPLHLRLLMGDAAREGFRSRTNVDSASANVPRTRRVRPRSSAVSRDGGLAQRRSWPKERASRSIARAGARSPRTIARRRGRTMRSTSDRARHRQARPPSYPIGLSQRGERIENFPSQRSPSSHRRRSKDEVHPRCDAPFDSSTFETRERSILGVALEAHPTTASVSWRSLMPPDCAA